jgi:hypothetical protein
MTGIMLVGLLALASLAWTVGNNLVSGMLCDELRTRVDRLAGLFVSLALRRLPPEMREVYRPDWEGVLLASFYDENAGLPITRVCRSIEFGFILWAGAGRIRKEANQIQVPTANESFDSFVVENIIESGLGDSRRWDLEYRTRSGEHYRVKLKNPASIARWRETETELMIDGLRFDFTELRHIHDDLQAYPPE